MERDRYALDAEKKENIELLKTGNNLKMAVSEKETELEAVMAKRKCLEEKKKIFHKMFTRNIYIKCIFTYLMI